MYYVLSIIMAYGYALLPVTLMYIVHLFIDII